MRRRFHWNITERDALAILRTISLVHRRLDRAVQTHISHVPSGCPAGYGESMMAQASDQSKNHVFAAAHRIPVSTSLLCFQ
jgi:hypothetical protein